MDLDNRILFAEKLINLLEKGKISHRIFRKTLFIEYGWNTLFQEQFQQEKVRKILIRIRNSKFVETELKQYMDRILSGKALQDIKNMRADGMLPMRSVSESYLARQGG